MLKSIFESLYIIQERKKAEEKFRRSSYSLTHLQSAVQKDLNLSSVTSEQESDVTVKLIPVGRIQLLDRFKRLLAHQRLRRKES